MLRSRWDINFRSLVYLFLVAFDVQIVDGSETFI